MFARFSCHISILYARISCFLFIIRKFFLLVKCFARISCYNNKKFNLRIYKTNWLENYIINTLKFKVNGE